MVEELRSDFVSTLDWLGGLEQAPLLHTCPVLAAKNMVCLANAATRWIWAHILAPESIIKKDTVCNPAADGLPCGSYRNRNSLCYQVLQP